MTDTVERDKALLSDALLEAARRDLGDVAETPDIAELQAYLAGELPEEQADRVRDWVVATEGASDQVLDLAPFVEARPPADGAPADLAEEASWQALQRRLADDEAISESPASPIGPASLPDLTIDRPALAGRWWQALAAVLTLTSSLLLLRVLHLESLRSPQNLRKFDLVLDARGGRVETFSIVPAEPFLVEISPGPAADGCQTFKVDFLDLDARVVQSVENLHLTDYVLRFVLSTQPGERWLTVSACGVELDRRRVNLFAE